ncbi:MAG: hypothetical protein QNL33_03050 [Akkermansiaceae bacterium]|jgi:hypothetical protein
MKAAIIPLFLIASIFTALADDPRTVKKMSKEPFDVAKEVEAFVEQVIKKDPAISAQYEKLIAATKEEAGGKFSEQPFEAIEWLVNAYTARRFTAEGGGSDKESIYLVRRQLMSAYSRGYSIPENVIAQVTVNEASLSKPGEGDNYIHVKTELTLHFDGFVKVAVTPQ